MSYLVGQKVFIDKLSNWGLGKFLYLCLSQQDQISFTPWEG